MSSQPTPAAVTSRALRVQLRDGLRPNAEENPERPLKRKNESNLDSNEIGNSHKKRTLKDSNEIGNSHLNLLHFYFYLLWLTIIDNLCDCTAAKTRTLKQIRPGGRTNRERLLKILAEQHVKKKKPRTLRPLNQSAKQAIIQERPLNQHEVVHPIIRPSSTINYEQFSDIQLTDMLKIVGLDTSGFDRKALLQNCNTYTELSNEDFQSKVSCLVSLTN